MHLRGTLGGLAFGAVLLSLAASWLAAGPAHAQSSTASIRGTVTFGMAPLDGARVTAVDSQTGFQYSAITASDGSFQLPGLRPGTYEIRVGKEGYEAQSSSVQVLLGQTATVSFQLTPESLFVENVTVIGSRILETRTSTVGTNVTTEQIEALPQNNRNFLNFAQLAPGVRVSDDEFNKQFRAQGQPGFSTNVFIDGASYKNDVLEGGVVGQDSSRGNPFPQNAVQEFQVLTSNYKAEYEKASTSIITAVTKSGGNTWSGDAFLYFSDKSFVTQDFFAKQSGADKPEYERFQGGFSIGGPIVEDKLTMFLSYEENRQDRANRVFLGSAYEGFDTTPFQQYEGNFTSPFRSKLLFGKLSWQPTMDQVVEFSLNWRNETDKRGFGGQTTFESAENVKVDVSTVMVKHKYFQNNWLNEASVSFQRFDWNPTALDFSTPGRNYFGFIRVGGRETQQDFTQDRISLRNDLTFFVKNASGDHTFKTGAVISAMDYKVRKLFAGNPVFNFRFDPANNLDFEVPFEAIYGAGNPDLSTSNTQYGVYFQDDWVPTPRLTLNLGLRWDYETDMLNNDYVTPQAVIDALSGAGPVTAPAGYFTDGGDRPSYKKAWQPRIGFSYDLQGDGSSVIFGGYGRYYDRVVYNYGLDEKFRLNWAIRRFCFVQDGAFRDDCPESVAIEWDPSYLSKEGLDTLIAQGRAGDPEVFLIKNDTRPPVSDQFSVGYRHSFGGKLLATVSATRTKSDNGFTFIFGNRLPNGECCQPVGGGFSNLLLSTDDKRYWYKGAFLTLERPITVDGKWGFTATYTYGKAEQQGGDLFSLDFRSVQDFPRSRTPDDERHRVVGTAIFRIPWDVQLSTILTLGSGTGYTIFDATDGFGIDERVILYNEGKPDRKAFIAGDWWAYRQLDVRAQKSFRLGGDQSIAVIAEAFNILNFKNFGCYNGFIPPAGEINPGFGTPGCIIGPTRTFQAGLVYAF
jgi:outer membrane receptor protein involved in Fe transport